MYYKDLSQYDHWGKYDVPTTKNVGWLDNEHPFETGITSQSFVEKLWIFCCFSTDHTLGYHECDFCQKPPFGLQVERNGEVLTLGSAEIRVLGQNDTIYAAPNLIYHYVVDHHYLPPAEFIAAVLSSPLPGTPEYQIWLTKYNWD
jgi:hypothetical protein